MDAYRLPSGYTVAAGFALFGWALWLLIVVVPYETPGALEVGLWGLMIGTLVAGYFVGVAAVVYRPTRRRGFQMLIGLTLMFPMLWVLIVALGSGSHCCE